jgi:hypothetical protein
MAGSALVPATARAGEEQAIPNVADTNGRPLPPVLLSVEIVPEVEVVPGEVSGNPSGRPLRNANRNDDASREIPARPVGVPVLDVAAP